jgi:phospholipid transport system substrate-binding protein
MWEHTVDLLVFAGYPNQFRSVEGPFEMQLLSCVVLCFGRRGYGTVVGKACLMCAMLVLTAIAADSRGAVVLAATAPASESVVDTSTPDGLVKAVVSDVISTLKSDPAIRGDRNRILGMMNQKVWPYVDIQLTTRLAMGREWLSMTPEQRVEMVREFKSLLSATYAGDLAGAGDRRVDYKPLRAAPDATDVVVQTQIVGRGQPVSVNYRLNKTGDGWRVYDLWVENAWVVPTYQKVFAEEINRHGIDGLIEYLKKRNQEVP